MKKQLLTVLAFAFSIVIANAQSKHIELEVDPIAYMLNGASGHIAYTWKNERIQIGYGQLTLPVGMRNHENVSEQFKSIALKWDYFFGRENANQGFFAGPSIDYMFLKYEDENANSLNDKQVNIGVRGGYKVNLFKDNKALKGLYITPWASVGRILQPKDIVLGEESYSRKAFTFFPTVHLG